MRPIRFALLPFIVFAGVIGCGFGGMAVSVGFSPPPDGLTPGNPAEVSLSVGIHPDQGSWAGRTVTLRMESSDAVILKPNPARLVLDAHGNGVFRFTIEAKKGAKPGLQLLTFRVFDKVDEVTSLKTDVLIK